MKINNIIKKYFYHNKFIGSFNQLDKNIGTGIAGKASCGDIIKLQIKVNNDIIEDVKYKTFGCTSAIASSALLSELIINKHINEVNKIKNTDIANYLKLPPIKLHCSILAEEVINEAIKNYKIKNNI